jgi:hypothetical protein
MAAETIHITIAGKVLPVKADSRAEGERYLRAAALVEDKMEQYAGLYNIRQSQDLMAMCLLEFALAQQDWQDTQQKVDREVSDLHAMLREVL